MRPLQLDVPGSQFLRETAQVGYIWDRKLVFRKSLKVALEKPSRKILDTYSSGLWTPPKWPPQLPLPTSTLLVAQGHLAGVHGKSSESIGISVSLRLEARQFTSKL